MKHLSPRQSLCIGPIAKLAFLLASVAIILFARGRRNTTDKTGALEQQLNELLAENRQLREQLQRKERQEKLVVEERNLLRTLIDIFPDLIYAKDSNSRFIVVNRAMLKRSGLSDFHELIGKTDADIFPGETAEQYQADDQEVMQSGKMLIGKEEIGQVLDGEPNWIMTTKVPLRNAAGEIIGTVGISRDITERKQTEIELWQAHTALEGERARLLTIMDALTEGVVGMIYDEKGQPSRHYANRAFEELMGYTADEWNVTLLKRLKASETETNQTVNSFMNALETSGLWQAEMLLARRDGSEFDASVIANRVSDADGKMIGVVTVIRDISQKKQLDEQRSRLVANASHELRTPITNLLTRLYLLRRQPERAAEHMQILEKVSLRMRNLVEDLLEYSRLERGVIPLKPRSLDLTALVDDVINIQEAEADKKAIRITCHKPDEPIWIHADPDRITQVFTNLITNAINYTPKNGAIEVAFKIESDQVNVPLVAVSVRDTGIGIPPNLLPYIFEPFYRASEDINGTGLGLSITREIVRMHDGTIGVESVPGVGSTFTVRLSLADAPV